MRFWPPKEPPPIHWPSLGRRYSYGDLGIIFCRQPGYKSQTRVRGWDGAADLLGIGWRPMGDFYSRVPDLGPYVPGLFDCENIAKCTAGYVARYWRDDMLRLPEADRILLAHGTIFGIIPNDGTNVGTGPHALNWFIDNEETFWLYGPQERSIKGRGEVLQMEEIWEINIE